METPDQSPAGRAPAQARTPPSEKPPRGTRDIRGEDLRRVRWIEETAGAILSSYGYEEVRTPIFEAEELFSRSVGEETDIVGKELYSFTDRKGRRLALRPEGTASAVRALIASGQAAGAGVTRWWYAGPMFRYERPQAGRQRQFHQVGAEVFGAAGPAAEVEIILLARDLLTATGIQDAEVRINFLGCASCRPGFRAALVAFLAGKELCPDCLRRRETNPLRVLDCKVPSCRAVLAGHPNPADHLCDECRVHKKGFLELLDAAGVPYRLDTALVRGLDYYTRTVFEVIHTGLGAQDAILGGGRYDNLVADLGGPSRPAVGFAAGIERWASLLAPMSDETKRIDVFPLSEADLPAAQACASRLRAAGPGLVTVRLGLDPRSPRAALRGAEKAGVDFVVLIGENERVKGIAQLKRMKDGSEFPVPLGDDLPASLVDEILGR